jgi:hypothetical protein
MATSKLSTMRLSNRRLSSDQGSGGSAAPSDVLAPKPFTNDDGEQVGTMPNNAGDNAALASSIAGTTLKLRAKMGFTDGIDDNVTITDANFVASKILAPNVLFGLTGTLVQGKRFATGNTSTDENSNIVVTGLLFQPSVIILSFQFGAVYRKVYNAINANPNNDSASYTGNSTPTVQISGSWSVTSNGFSTKILTQNGVFSVDWIAIE